MWRVIPTQAHDAFTNMGLEEACLEAVAKGESPPTFRFYRWQKSAVVIGYFQALALAVNLAECKKRAIDVTRRKTGGGACYLDAAGELTYSIVVPENFYSKDITYSYQELCGWIVQGLKSLGLNASFRPINDVVVDGKKISGNAQTRRKGVILHHGTLLYDLNPELMFSVLRIPRQKMLDKVSDQPDKAVTCIKRLGDFSLAAVEAALTKAFLQGKEWQVADWTEQEKARAQELASTCYQQQEWIAQC